MTENTTSGSSKWLRILLVLSLGLNLLVVGVGVGRVVAGDSSDKPPRSRDIGFGPYTRALSDNDRQALRGALMRGEREVRVGRAAMKKSFDDMLSALRADPFDSDALTAVFDDQLNVMTGRQKLGMSVMADRLIAATDAERAAFADRLEEGLSRQNADGPHKRP